MAGAELADSQLRSSIRAARTSGHRCFKAVITGAPGSESASDAQRTLTLATAVPEELGASLESEFSRCIEKLVDDAKPCLLLFRSDDRENVDGCRWLMIAWLPEAAPALERMTYMRSRGLLARIVPQPFFLHEFFASQRAELKWDKARAGSDTIDPKEHPEITEAVNSWQRGKRPPPIVATSLPQGPLRDGQNLTQALQRFARREDPCLRFSLSRVPGADNVTFPKQKVPQQALALDCQALDIRSPQQLGQGGLPQTTCFFAMAMRDHLLFISWSPDPPGTNKDPQRVMEDTRYAVLKTSILRIVLEAFPAPKPYVCQVDARDPQDIIDGARTAADTAKRVAAGVADTQPPLYSSQEQEAPRQPVHAQPVPSTMSIDPRPFPPWRGGSKTHTISSTGASRQMTMGASPGTGRRQTIRAPPPYDPSSR